MQRYVDENWVPGDANVGADSITVELVGSSFRRGLERLRKTLSDTPITLEAPIRTIPELAHLYPAVEREIASAYRSTLEFRSAIRARRAYVVGVTSAVVGEGKTTVAFQLAMSAAQDSHQRVCLLDMSLGADDHSRYLGVPSSGEGIIPLLEGSEGRVLCFQPSGVENLRVLPAGAPPESPARVARSPRVGELIGLTREMFDLVVVDLPAVITRNVGPVVPHLDGVVMVARAGVTPIPIMKQALDDLEGTQMMGVVLNRVSSSVPSWLARRLGRMY